MFRCVSFLLGVFVGLLSISNSAALADTFSPLGSSKTYFCDKPKTGKHKLAIKSGKSYRSTTQSALTSTIRKTLSSNSKLLKILTGEIKKSKDPKKTASLNKQLRSTQTADTQLNSALSAISDCLNPVLGTKLTFGVIPIIYDSFGQNRVGAIGYYSITNPFPLTTHSQWCLTFAGKNGRGQVITPGKEIEQTLKADLCGEGFGPDTAAPCPEALPVNTIAWRAVGESVVNNLLNDNGDNEDSIFESAKSEVVHDLGKEVVFARPKPKGGCDL